MTNRTGYRADKDQTLINVQNKWSNITMEGRLHDRAARQSTHRLCRSIQVDHLRIVVHNIMASFIGIWLQLHAQSVLEVS